MRALCRACLSATVVAGLLLGCSGPQPLDVAIRPADQAAWQACVAAGHPGTPRAAFFACKAEQTGQTVEQIAAADEALSHRSNPFDANNDHDAVSRGAVLYQAYCMGCHGQAVDGKGPDMPRIFDSMNWHSFGKRFAVTLHRGAPIKWFGRIYDGYDGGKQADDGTAIVMPPFKGVLSKEQIWLTITYLQTVDVYTPDRDE